MMTTELSKRLQYVVDITFIGCDFHKAILHFRFSCTKILTTLWKSQMHNTDILEISTSSFSKIDLCYPRIS